MLVFTVLYPFVFRDWIFDNIPRHWTLNYFKSFVLVLSFTVAGSSAFAFLIIPFLRLKKFERDYKLIGLIVLSFSAVITLIPFFWLVTCHIARNHITSGNLLS